MPQYAKFDPWLVLPIATASFIGALGFPVLVTIGRQWRHPRRWNLHAKLTMSTTVILFAMSVLMMAGFEWTNPNTLGGLGPIDRITNVLFLAVMPRSTGFAILPTDALHPQTWLGMDVLMFIGGGSASTAGGIKVSTLAVLFLATVAEARGDTDAQAFGRRIPSTTLRLAVTVLAAALTMVLVASMALVALTQLPLDYVVFDVISAFATCGLSLGITPDLPAAGKAVLIVLMFLGRTGTMTLAAALALRERPQQFRLAEERPIVG
jgi:Trk-type K+ transport system membrane component